ncbi:MAG: phosphonate metabolism protein/1,5-bisphosphokinase (PRPP-forming) PhnN, partial [Pseudomonadota bacterium]
MVGRLIAVVGPSGAGKDTLIDGACATREDLRPVRRAITRPVDAGGEAHEALTQDAFARRLEQGAFAIHWDAHGLSYGIPAEIDDWLASGATVLFNGSRAALPAARARYSGLEIILVTAPPDVLARRLATRGRETETDISERLVRKAYPIPDDTHVVVNDGSIDEGVARLLAVLTPSTQSA